MYGRVNIFANGNLPQQFLEDHNIVWIDEPDALAFQKDMQRIANRLLGTNTDNFRFLISAKESPNAFVISSAEPPIITFTQGLLKMLSNEDELAGILAHELTHRGLHKKFGDHNNSKPEEMAADIWPVIALHDAGYAPIAMQTALAKLPFDRKEIKRFDDYIDDHPGNELRDRIVENSRAALRNLKGKEKTEFSPFENPDVIAAAIASPHISYVKAFLRDTNFEAKDTLGKLAILAEFIDKENVGLSRTRIKDLAEAFDKTPVDKTNADEVALFNSIVDRIIGPKDAYTGPCHEYNAKSIYLAVQKAWEPEEDKPVLMGSLKNMADASDAFIHATNKEDASRSAIQILDAARRMRKNVFVDENYRYSFSIGSKPQSIVDADDCRWPHGFTMPSKEAVIALKKKLKAVDTEAEREQILTENTLTFPWLAHAAFDVAHTQAGGANEIHKAMEMLGVKKEWIPEENRHPRSDNILVTTSRQPPYDPLLKTNYTDYYDNNNSKEYGKPGHWDNIDHVPMPDKISSVRRQYRMEHLRTDDKHRIVNLRTAERNYTEGMPKDEYIAGERERMSDRDHDEKMLLPTVNWKLLEGDDRDFAKFLKEYRIELTPDMSVVDGGDTFAKEFITRMQAIIQKEPHKAEWLKSFLIEDGDNNLKGLKEEYKHLSEGDMASPGSLYYGMKAIVTDDSKRNELTNVISSQHAYVQFVLNDPEKMFDVSQRLDFIGSHTTYLNDKGLETPALERWNFDVEKLLGRPLSQNASEVVAHCDDLMKKTDYWSPPTSPSIFIDIAQTETIEALKKQGDKLLTLDEIQALRKMNKFSIASDFYSEAYKELEKQSLRFAREKLAENLPLEERIRIYQIFQSNQLFTNDPDLRAHYEESIVADIEKLGPGKDALAAAQQLLFTQKIENRLSSNFAATNYHSDIRNPDRRKRLLDITAKSYKEELGIDPGSNDPAGADYIEKAKKVVDHIVEKADGGNRYQILSVLADEIESQRELSYYIREKVIDASAIELAKKGMMVNGAEMSADRINQHDELRFATLNFLRKPATAESITEYRILSERYLNEGSLLHKDEMAAAQKVDKFGRKKLDLTVAARDEGLRSFHENFNSLPLEAKTIYTDLILFPPMRMQAEPALFEQSKNWVFDTVLPVEQKTRRIGKHKPSQQEFAREGVEHHMAVSDQADQRLMLSAMVVASDPTQVEGSNLGRSLKLVLYAHGPAGVKTAQAIHSHRQTPEDIKREMAEAKIMADKPPRWTIFDIYDKTVPDAERDECHRLGKVLGVGSYGITTENEMSDGSFRAYTLLKPNAEARATREFSRIGKVTDRIIKDHPEVEPLRDMIHYAEKMSGPETDMDVAHLQSKKAAENYDGLTIKADGLTCHFSAAPWVSHGQDKVKETGYKSTHVIEGKHFQDMPEGTEDEKELKRKVAKAIMLSETIMLSSGRTFDHDRHGGQQRIVVEGDQVYVGNFDFGAMSLEPPTKEQKEAFAHILVDTFASHMFHKAKNTALNKMSDAMFKVTQASEVVAGISGESGLKQDRREESASNVSKVFSDRVARYKNKPEVIDHIASIERGLLATDSIMKYLSDKDKMEVLATAMVNDHVDQDFKQAFSQRMPLIYPLIEAKMKSMRSPEVSFEYREEAQRRIKQPQVRAAEQTLQETGVDAPDASPDAGDPAANRPPAFASRFRRIAAGDEEHNRDRNHPRESEHRHPVGAGSKRDLNPARFKKDRGPRDRSGEEVGIK